MKAENRGKAISETRRRRAWAGVISVASAAKSGGSSMARIEMAHRKMAWQSERKISYQSQQRSKSMAKMAFSLNGRRKAASLLM
jgi:hypothetical protein